MSSRYVPPPDLEERVVRSLQSRNLIRSARGPFAGSTARKVYVAASIVALFATGLVIRRALRAPEADSSSAPRFVLLLYGDAGATTPEIRLARVEEYRAWVGEVARGGNEISGEELAPEARVLSSGALAPRDSSAGNSGPTGYFVFQARDVEEAMKIAQSCPHLRHGGSAVLRRIEPT